MGKKRTKKITASIFPEGKSEDILIKHLKEVFLKNKTKLNLTIEPATGGNPSSILMKALRCCHKNKVYLMLDEDKDLNEEAYKALAKQWKINPENNEEFFKTPLRDLNSLNNKNLNPHFIISMPCCFEGFIINEYKTEIMSDKKFINFKTLSEIDRLKLTKDLKKQYNSYEDLRSDPGECLTFDEQLKRFLALKLNQKNYTKLRNEDLKNLIEFMNKTQSK
jgi:hypothetical protein